MQGPFSCGMQTLNCGMWDLVPWSGIELGPPTLGARSLSHWTTREVPRQWHSKNEREPRNPMLSCVQSLTLKMMGKKEQ